MGQSDLRALARERWMNLLPAVIRQAKVEALQNSNISNLLSVTNEGKCYFFNPNPFKRITRY